jgi:hypothetical protein
LVLVSELAWEPASVVSGDRKAKGSIAVTVRNDTNAAFNGSVTVSVLASQDAVADSGDVAVVQSDKRLKLKVGQTKVVKLKASMTSIPVGAYTLLGAATASNLTSFAAGPAVNVQTAFVHLVSGGTATPPKKPIAAGKKTSLSVPMRNDGNIATSKTPATYTLEFSTDGGAMSVFQMTATGKVRLKAGQSKPQKVSFVVPAGSVPAGTYSLVVKLSAELNDTNSQVVTTVPVSVV